MIRLYADALVCQAFEERGECLVAVIQSEQCGITIKWSWPCGYTLLIPICDVDGFHSQPND